MCLKIALEKGMSEEEYKRKREKMRLKKKIIRGTSEFVMERSEIVPKLTSGKFYIKPSAILLYLRSPNVIPNKTRSTYYKSSNTVDSTYSQHFFNNIKLEIKCKK